jgi:hypothetical protein
LAANSQPNRLRKKSIDARIVDQNVEPIHRRLGRVDEATHLGECREVGRKESRRAPLASMSATTRAPLSASRVYGDLASDAIFENDDSDPTLKHPGGTPRH